MMGRQSSWLTLWQSHLHLYWSVQGPIHLPHLYLRKHHSMFICLFLLFSYRIHMLHTGITFLIIQCLTPPVLNQMCLSTTPTVLHSLVCKHSQDSTPNCRVVYYTLCVYGSEMPILNLIKIPTVITGLFPSQNIWVCLLAFYVLATSMVIYNAHKWWLYSADSLLD